jgi:hypothetical protein
MKAKKQTLVTKEMMGQMAEVFVRRVAQKMAINLDVVYDSMTESGEPAINVGFIGKIDFRDLSKPKLVTKMGFNVPFRDEVVDLFDDPRQIAMELEGEELKEFEGVTVEFKAGGAKKKKKGD